MQRTLAFISLLLLGAQAWAGAPDCRQGTYRLDDGRIVDVAAAGANLRWRLLDGTTGLLAGDGNGALRSTLGWTDHPDGRHVSFGPCAQEAIDFDGVHGAPIAFQTTESRFAGAGVTLAGRLVMPEGSARVPIVVLIHGAEHDSARDASALQRLFPAAGIGAFVYDKRGTGASGGRYSQDFLTLADDAVAAAREARRLAGPRAGRVGYQAGSQGGWVAPLAARIEPVDFVIVSFGLAVSPLEEDRSAIALDLARHGFGPDDEAKAMQVADATGEVLLSGFREGYEQVEDVRKKFGREPWFKYVHGNVSFFILEHPESELRKVGPTLFPGAPLQYDPMPVLRNLKVPQLWALGEDDIDAPSAETARRVADLIGRGAPISLAVFPSAEHGMYEYEVASDGSRLSTRQPWGYFAMMVDFIRNGHLGTAYGTAKLTPAARP